MIDGQDNEQQQQQADLFSDDVIQPEEHQEEQRVPLKQQQENEQQQQQQQPDQPEDQQPPSDEKGGQQTVPSQIPLTQEQFNALLERQQQKAPEQTREQQLAEVRKQLNPFVATDQHLKSIGFEDPTPEQVAGFQNVINAVVKNAVSASAYMMKQQQERFESELTPVQQAVAEYQKQQAENSFKQTYPELEKYYDAIVLPLAKEMSSDPAVRNLSVQDQFKALANEARSRLQKLGVPLSQDSHKAGNQHRQTVPASPRPAATVTPSRSPSGPKQSSVDDQASIYS